MSKTLKQIQEETDVWANQFEKPYFSPLSMLATSLEELGEIARIINVMYGDKNAKPNEDISKESLTREIGDLLFTVICIANEQKLSLDEAFELKINKLYQRDNNRFEKKK